MEDTNLIKSITTHVCPHCDNMLYIESQFTPPVVGTLFTADMMADAKKDCIERVKTLSIDEEKKESVMKWLNDPETIFSGSEVDSIINSILRPEK